MPKLRFTLEIPPHMMEWFDYRKLVLRDSYARTIRLHLPRPSAMIINQRERIELAKARRARK